MRTQEQKRLCKQLKQAEKRVMRKIKAKMIEMARDPEIALEDAIDIKEEMENAKL